MLPRTLPWAGLALLLASPPAQAITGYSHDRYEVLQWSVRGPVVALVRTNTHPGPTDGPETSAPTLLILGLTDQGPFLQSFPVDQGQPPTTWEEPRAAAGAWGIELELVPKSWRQTPRAKHPSADPGCAAGPQVEGEDLRVVCSPDQKLALALYESTRLSFLEGKKPPPIQLFERVGGAWRQVDLSQASAKPRTSPLRRLGAWLGQARARLAIAGGLGLVAVLAVGLGRRPRRRA